MEAEQCVEEVVERHECSLCVYSSKKDLNENEGKKSSSYYYCLTRLNQEFFKCAVYDSGDPSTARLIGVEYIVSDRIFHVLPPDEQKLWHSHSYEIKDNLWINIRILEILQTTELRNLSRSYGKFWSTWQWDNGDALPLGAPSSSLVMSSPVLNMNMVKPVWNGEAAASSNCNCDHGEWNKKPKERFITYKRRLKREKERKMSAAA